MRTRDGSREPAKEASEWGAFLREIGCRRFELRTDSTLRGAAAEELAGLLDALALADPWVLAVPAFPDAGRTTVDGMQRVPEAGVAREIDVSDRIFPGSSRSIIRTDHLESGGRQVVAFMQAAARRGTRRFIADATNDRHLSAIAGAVSLVEGDGTELVTASPGAWLRYHPAAVPRSRFVLVVLASPTEQNRQQLDELVASTKATVLEPTEGTEAERMDWSLEGHPERGGDASVVVVQTVRGSPEGIGDPAAEAVRSATDLLGRTEREGGRCIGLVVSGGRTAGLLMDALGARGVRALDEIRPLCGSGQLVGGGWDGLSIITKGGLVGDPSTLRELVESLVGEPRR
jgi:uncharacterized protein YgbK (DUF1537 family)